MVSAIKDGVALYKLARKGIEIERETRAVHIHRFEITHFNNPFMNVAIECSKGTYVRTLPTTSEKPLDVGLPFRTAPRCFRTLRDQAHTLDDILTETRETLVERTLTLEILP